MMRQYVDENVEADDLSDTRAAFPPPWGGRVRMAVVIVGTVVGRPPTAPVIRAYEIVNILHIL